MFCLALSVTHCFWGNIRLCVTQEIDSFGCVGDEGLICIHSGVLLVCQEMHVK